MALSVNIHQYADVRQVLDTAVKAGGGVYTAKNDQGIPTTKAATRWRARAHYFRALIFKQKRAENLIPGFTPATPYDDLQLFILPEAPTEVVIKVRAPQGDFRTFSGELIDTAGQLKKEQDDEVENAAEAFARQLRGGTL